MAHLKSTEKNSLMASFSMLVFQDGPELADSWYNFEF